MPSLLKNPMSLGYLTVGGSPVSVIENYSTYTDLVANKVECQALKTNAGTVYVGYSGMNTTSGVGVLKALQPGESWVLAHNVGMNVIPAAELYIHGSNAGDKALVVVHVV